MLHPNPNKPVGPDNVWYIAKHDSLVTDGENPTPVYAVCIARTAGTGEGFDGEVEDKAVGRVVDLNQWIPESFAGNIIPGPTVELNPDFTGSAPYVSYGTAIGTYMIGSTSPAVPEGQTSTHPTVSEFLKNERVAPGTRLIFTGHSPGGALSPTLAIVLHKAKLLGNFSKVLVYPTVGASPGDANFVAEFKQRFPAIPPVEGQPAYTAWNQNITNHLDIVPHAWCTLKTCPQNLAVLPTLYGNGPGLAQGPEAYWYLVGLQQTLINGANKAWPTKPKQNVYIPLPSSVFSSPEKSFPKNQKELIAMVTFTHIRAYIDYICGPDFKFTPGPCAAAASEMHAPMEPGCILRYAEGVTIDREAVEAAE
ncbi:hypothetical protein FRC11_006650 [Ceratobasidium sp. 423]|nr:hypothetical protein FRC11_006650 [Ceratobasidium sp. 423]